MAPRKSIPKSINPASPQKNFVQACYENKGDKEGFYDYMYGSPGPYSFGNSTPSKGKASGFGHSVERRQGNLRMSGHPGAHRIGSRKSK